jgi:hypothetical protein
MILGISKISWIEQLTSNELYEYFDLVDKLLVVVDYPEDEWVDDDKVFYKYGDYDNLRDVLAWWSMCKSYPRKTLYSLNYAFVEIPVGCTAQDLKRSWLHELQHSGVLQ